MGEPSALRDGDVPDAIEPLTAFRAWRHVPNDSRAQLHPMARRPGEVWLPNAWTEARCLAGGLSAYVRRSHAVEPHAAPHEGCTCGLYGMRTLDDLVDELSTLGLRALSSAGIVVGRVELAGKVVEHELGYRAQYGRVVELLSAPGVLEVPFAAAAQYGVPVSDDLRPALERSAHGPGPRRPDPPPPTGGWRGRLAQAFWRRGPMVAGLLGMLFLFVIIPWLGHSSNPGPGLVVVAFVISRMMLWSRVGRPAPRLSVGPQAAGPGPPSGPPPRPPAP